MWRDNIELFSRYFSIYRPYYLFSFHKKKVQRMPEKSFAPLKEVIISDAVVQSCYHHALSTEKEEIMGVLLGEVVQLSEKVKIARLWATFPIQRSDKRKDRVEVAPEMLIRAGEVAECLTDQCEKHTRVIGWYHSHPHITPYPSHVDLQSQKIYQHMESAWVGLIFSVFHTTNRSQGSVTLHCFRTGPNNDHEKINFVVVPAASMMKLPPPRYLPSVLLLATLKDEMAALLLDCVDRVSSETCATSVVPIFCAVASAQTFKVAQLLGVPLLSHLQVSVLPELKQSLLDAQRELQKQQENFEEISC